MNDVEPHVTTINLEHPSSHGLRRLADFLDLCSTKGIKAGKPDTLSIFDLGGEEHELETIVKLAKALGSFKKDFSGDIFTLEKDFSGVVVRFIAYRKQICERVVVDTIQVPEVVIPAHTKEVVEWKCPGPLHSLDVEPQALESA